MSASDTRQQQIRNAVNSYRSRNPERVKKWRAGWYQRAKNKESYQQTIQEYRETHKDEIKASRKEYNSRPENKATKRRLERERDQKARLDLIMLLGGKCVNCSKRGIILDVRALTMDHKNGNGSKDRARFKSIYDLYRYYLDNPELAKKELQVMCFNCNHLKRYENGEGCLTEIAAFNTNPETSFKN